MRVVVCGAGQVGASIAERLAAEQNDVSVIDISPRLIQSISDRLDVRGFVGHGSHPEVLARAGAGDADMLIAVTLHDEVNMVACQVAHSLFNVPTKVARVRAQSYLRAESQALFTADHMPIDVIISPEVEVGEMVLRRLAMPGAFDAMSFAEGAVLALGISCNEDCPIVDTPLSQLTDLFPGLKAVVVGIGRGDRLFVPRSADALLPGDQAYVVTDRNQVQRVLHLFGHEEKQAQRVIIAGGGNVGRYVACELEKRHDRATLKVIEASRDRAVEIADDLHRTVVLHGSALDKDILDEADVQDADILLALTNDDEVNILSCVMAKRLGTKRSLCLINNPSYPILTAGLGIDVHVNPRGVTVSKILQYVRRGRIRAVHSVADGRAEILEAEALETSPLVGKPLRELDLFDGMRIGAIYRKGQVVIPTGDTVVEAHDRVVIFALADRVRRVEQMFRVSIEFF